MPCQKDGVKGWKFGQSGTCYTGPGAKDKALQQAAAIEANKLDGDALAAVLFSTEGSSGWIKKADQELQIVWGEVYAPGVPDSQGDFMNADEIREMAYRFSKSGRLNKVDVQHDNVERASLIVETFVARPGDPDFIEGAWVVGVHVPDPVVWKAIKDGELNGFSMEASGQREVQELVVKIPNSVTGRTMPGGEDEHDHDFEVEFADDGTLIGGATGPGGKDKHRHDILKGTITEEAGETPHTHRFSFVELMLQQQGMDDAA